MEHHVLLMESQNTGQVLDQRWITAEWTGRSRDKGKDLQILTSGCVTEQQIVKLVLRQIEQCVLLKEMRELMHLGTDGLPWLKSELQKTLEHFPAS